MKIFKTIAASVCSARETGKTADTFTDALGQEIAVTHTATAAACGSSLAESGKTDITVLHDLDFVLRYSGAATAINDRYHAVYLGSGQNVAMLNIANVSPYSSCTYIAAELAKTGFETKMRACVPSFCAAAAELNIPIAEGSESLTIIPAQYENARG